MTGLSLTGLWYYVVAVPILQFFAFRWLWRLIIWTMFLRDMARLDLVTVSTHADGAGGLGFLGAAHTSLAIFPFAVSCILSAHVAFQLYFEGASIESFKGLLVVYLIVVELLCLGPLGLFLPLLARTRRQGLRQYSQLGDTLNRAFEQKWVDGKPADEQFLGSADISAVCDYSTCFRLIQDMRRHPVHPPAGRSDRDCRDAAVPAARFPGAADRRAAEAAGQGAGVIAPIFLPFKAAPQPSH